MQSLKVAICPGSFDPVTLGHINIIKRAAVAFDKVIVCVMVNSEKNGGLFTPEERIDLMRKSIQVSNVEFDVNYGLVAEYAKAEAPGSWSRACGQCPTLSRKSRWR